MRHYETSYSIYKWTKSLILWLLSVHLFESYVPLRDILYLYIVYIICGTTILCRRYDSDKRNFAQKFTSAWVIFSSLMTTRAIVLFIFKLFNQHRMNSIKIAIFRMILRTRDYIHGNWQNTQNLLLLSYFKRLTRTLFKKGSYHSYIWHYFKHLFFISIESNIAKFISMTGTT